MSERDHTTKGPNRQPRLAERIATRRASEGTSPLAAHRRTLAGASGWYGVARLCLGGSVDPEAAQLNVIERDTQARTLRNARSCEVEGQGLGEQVGLVIMRAEDVGRIGRAVDIWYRAGQVQHR